LRVTAPAASEDPSPRQLWSRFGILLGALFGFVLSALLIATRLATDILSIGVVRTIMVAAIECVVITGGFAALAAALLRKGGTPSEPSLTAGGENAETGLQTENAFHAASPDHAADDATYSLSQARLISDSDWGTSASLPTIQASLNTIDAWENGNTGP